MTTPVQFSERVTIPGNGIGGRMRRRPMWSRGISWGQRALADRLFRRSVELVGSVAYISFSFDDFPRSALRRGGRILQQVGLHGTYYASLGLMGTDGPYGQMFSPGDIEELLAQGHELGCHTFAHSHSLSTPSRAFEASILQNRRALTELVPGATFGSFSYPISGPRLDTKRRVARLFRCSRGGGQTFNAGITDLNLLRAFFLEKSRDTPATVKEVISRTCQRKGWLILATHDIGDTPTPYGCTPSHFEEVVGCAVDSGARILPVARALDAIWLNAHAGWAADRPRSAGSSLLLGGR